MSPSFTSRINYHILIGFSVNHRSTKNTKQKEELVIFFFGENIILFLQDAVL